MNFIKGKLINYKNYLNSKFQIMLNYLKCKILNILIRSQKILK